eukprot:scaffold4066_cov417-Prasinococcus_capsulatus_cf.AAC.20
MTTIYPRPESESPSTLGVVAGVTDAEGCAWQVLAAPRLMRRRYRYKEGAAGAGVLLMQMRCTQQRADCKGSVCTPTARLTAALGEGLAKGCNSTVQH